MQTLRAFAHNHRRLAVLMVMLALVIKALVPAGYMLSQNGTVITVTICTDASRGAVTRQIAIPLKGAADDTGSAHAKAPAACPYAALSMAALAGADAMLLAVALAFVMALGLAPTRIAPMRRIPFLRPHLRGPPAFA